jgi:hypothetical protein
MSDIEEKGLASKILKVHSEVLRCTSGDLAQLRRMTGSRRCAMFWKIVAAHLETSTSEASLARWSEIVNLFALLTPSGEPRLRPDHHDPKVRVGAAIFDADVNESRIIRFGVGPYDKRRENLVRTLRGRGIAKIDVVELATLFLVEGQWPWDKIAEGYYRENDKKKKPA